MAAAPDDGLVLQLAATVALSAPQARGIEALFVEGYREADLSYLRDAVRRLRHVGLAFDGERLVGFSLGESRRLDLPGLPGQVVRLAGLACVAAPYRRRNLMGRISAVALGAELAGEPGMFCGRMAHPATYRMMSRLRGVVPRLGVRPTPWQQAVARGVAAAYGVPEFDAETFVCRGRGRPIGYPVIDIEASPDDWALFAPVDRDRGDSLLGLSWFDAPPPGW
jgi:hypothetical protein